MIRCIFSLFIFKLFWCVIHAQTIFIKSYNNQPLEFAYILNTSNGNWSISNQNGLAPIPDKTKFNDTLLVQRYGYKSISLNFQSDDNLILLTAQPLIFETVEVESNKGFSAFNKINISKSSGLENISHKEYLELLPGVQIRTLGGPGSISTVSLNGGPTSQTKVTLNGFDLSNMQTGVTDLSQLPNAFIDEARVITSGNKSLGSGSQNGILELSTWRPNNSFSQSISSLNSKSSYAKLAWQSKLLHTAIILGEKNDKGDFLVSWRDESFKRENNKFNQSYASLQFNGRISNKLFFKGLSLITKQKRGVPGQVWSPSEAKHFDNLIIYASSLNWISRLGKGSLKYFNRRSSDNYENPQYSIEDKNNLKSSSLTISNSIFRTKNMVVDFSSKAQNQILESDQKTYKKNIIITNFRLVYELRKGIVVTPSFQHNFSENFFNHTTYSFLGTYSFKNKVFDQLALSSSSHFRHPTFNDLYWQPGGNPDLQPEFGDNYSLSISLKPNYFGAFDFIYFNSITDDLIQWLPVGSYWQAKNVNDVKRYGISGNWSKNTEYFQSRFSFSLVESFFGKDKLPLRYSPKSIGTIFLEKKISSFTISLNTHFSAEMISMYSYPKDNIIPSSTTTSLHSSKTFNFKNFEVIGMLSILNIFNNQYESSKGYPEPGRSIGFTITLNQKRK